VYDLTVRYFTTSGGKLTVDHDRETAFSVHVDNTGARCHSDREDRRRGRH